MGDAQMELGEREFERIGEYVKTHLKEWISESGVDIRGENREQRPPTSNAEEALALRNRELDLIERVVRVEDELKNLREVMEERFGRMDERFSKIDERFEAQQKLMDERFEAQRELMSERFEAQQNQIDTRFEAQQKLMNERFDHMEKRTAFIQWGIGIGFTSILVLMVVLNYLG